MLSPSRVPGKIALLGAAYKADVDDTRESPMHAVLRLLQERRHAVAVYDPLARNAVEALAPTIEEAVRWVCGFARGSSSVSRVWWPR